MKREESILLDVGTNELEVIELIVKGQSFGINVAKVREIISIKPEQIHKAPNSHASVIGMLDYRGTPYTLVDLKEHLFAETTSPQEVVVVVELNQTVTAFLVDGISRIYRLTWKDIHPLDPYLIEERTPIVGVINLEGRQVLLVDLESVMGEISPTSSNFSYEHDISESEKRLNRRIFFAEDSKFLQKALKQGLIQAGYKNISFFNDGEDAWEALFKLKQRAQNEDQPISNFVSALITDIEMPRMDGLTLCRKVKSDPALKNIPVLIFSSLINKQMEIKCQTVGADAYKTKPKFSDVISIVDAFCEKNEANS